MTEATTLIIAGVDVDENNKLTAALAYAARGWPVFPCSPGRKEPATTNGFYDASTDPNEICQWWQRSPRSNVAIATGCPGPDVLDIDIKHVDGYANLERLKRVGLVAGPTMLVTTPSGGLHLYYAGTDQGCHVLRRFGVDLRASGGYVLAPPSIADDRPYQLADERPPTGEVLNWERVRRFLDPPIDQPPRTGTGSRSGSSIDPLARWVGQQPDGNRNCGLYWAARRALDDGHEDLEPLVTAAVTAGLPEREARRTVRSAVDGASHG